MKYRNWVCESERNEICRKTDFQLYLSQKRVWKNKRVWKYGNGCQNRMVSNIRYRTKSSRCSIVKSVKKIHINIINIGHILGASVKGKGKCWFVIRSLVWVHYIQCSEFMRIYWKNQRCTIWGMKIPIQIPINILVSLFQFFGFIRNGKIKWSTNYDLFHK